jgi:uncharacterized protein (DUF736 family)
MQIGSAWKKTSKNNNEFISVSIEIPFLGKLNFVLFQNDEKKSSNSPDYSVVWNSIKKENSENIDENQTSF